MRALAVVVIRVAALTYYSVALFFWAGQSISGLEVTERVDYTYFSTSPLTIDLPELAIRTENATQWQKGVPSICLIYKRMLTEIRVEHRSRDTYMDLL